MSRKTIATYIDCWKGNETNVYIYIIVHILLTILVRTTTMKASFKIALTFAYYYFLKLTYAPGDYGTILNSVKVFLNHMYILYFEYFTPKTVFKSQQHSTTRILVHNLLH